MKKLLLLISLVYYFFIIVSCQNTTKPINEANIVTKSEIKDSIIASDTPKTNNRVKTSGIVGNGQGIKKDSTRTSTNTSSIIHGDPNQAKIDSIKNSKIKGKK